MQEVLTPTDLQAAETLQNDANYLNLGSAAAQGAAPVVKHIPVTAGKIKAKVVNGQKYLSNKTVAELMEDANKGVKTGFAKVKDVHIGNTLTAAKDTVVSGFNDTKEAVVKGAGKVSKKVGEVTTRVNNMTLGEAADSTGKAIKGAGKKAVESGQGVTTIKGKWRSALDWLTGKNKKTAGNTGNNVTAAGEASAVPNATANALEETADATKVVKNTGGAISGVENIEKVVESAGNAGAPIVEQTTKAAVTTLPESAGAFAKTGEVLGKIATPLAIAAGTFEAASAIKKKRGRDAAKAIGGTGGGLAAGAVAATAFGLGTGGLGFIAEAAIGIGAYIGGSFVGSKATDAVAGKRFDKWLHRKDKLKNPALPANAPMMAKTNISNTAVTPDGKLVNNNPDDPADLGNDDQKQGEHVARLMAERNRKATLQMG